MLAQCLLGLLVLTGLLFWQWAMLQDFYAGIVMTTWEWGIYAGLGAVGVIAVLRGLWLLQFYRLENAAIDEFMEQLDFTLTLAGLESIRESLIVRRYRAMQQSRGNSDCLSVLSASLWREEQVRGNALSLARRTLLLIGIVGAMLTVSRSLFDVSADGLVNVLELRLLGALLIHDLRAAVAILAVAATGYFVLLLLDSRLRLSREHVCQRIDALSVRQLEPMLT